MVTASVSAAFDIAELPQDPNFAIGVLNKEFVATVLERQNPTTGLNGEGRSTCPFVIGSSGLGYGKPEGFIGRRGPGVIRTAGRIHGGTNGVAHGTGIGGHDRRGHGGSPSAVIAGRLGGRRLDSRLLGVLGGGRCLRRRLRFSRVAKDNVGLGRG